VKNRKGSLALQELKLEHLLLNAYCSAYIKNRWFNHEVPFVKYVSYTKFSFHAAYTLVRKVTTWCFVYIHTSVLELFLINPMKTSLTGNLSSIAT
jgi:hypothetical protein